MRYYLSGLIILSLAWSCSTDPTGADKNPESTFFPMKEFMEVQAQKLEGYGLRKMVRIKGNEQLTEETLHEADWLKEFDVFIQADINKPALAKSYETERSQQYLIHKLKPGEKGKIKKIVVKYEGDLIKEISFHAKSDNLFYSSETRGLIYTNSVTGTLDQLLIDATQKVVFLSPNHMIIKASSVIPG